MQELSSIIKYNHISGDVTQTPVSYTAYTVYLSKWRTVSNLSRPKCMMHDITQPSQVYLMKAIICCLLVAIVWNQRWVTKVLIFRPAPLAVIKVPQWFHKCFRWCLTTTSRLETTVRDYLRLVILRHKENLKKLLVMSQLWCFRWGWSNLAGRPWITTTRIVTART